MKRLIIPLLLLIPTYLHAVDESVTTGRVGLLKLSTDTRTTTTRNWGDVNNSNLDIIASSMNTIIDNLAAIALDTSTLNSNLLESSNTWTGSNTFRSSTTFEKPLSSITVQGNIVAIGSITARGIITSTSGFLVAGSTVVSLSFGVGAVNAPSLYLAGDRRTGWYRPASNQWAFAIAGSRMLEFKNFDLVLNNGQGARFISGNGSVLSPAYSFDDNTQTGWWLEQGADLRMSHNGRLAFTINFLGEVGIGGQIPSASLHVATTRPNVPLMKVSSDSVIFFEIGTDSITMSVSTVIVTNDFEVVGGSLILNGVGYTWGPVAPSNNQVPKFNNTNKLVEWKTIAGGGGGGGGAIFEGDDTVSFSTFSLPQFDWTSDASASTGLLRAQVLAASHTGTNFWTSTQNHAVEYSAFISTHSDRIDELQVHVATASILIFDIGVDTQSIHDAFATRSSTNDTLIFKTLNFNTTANVLTDGRIPNTTGVIFSTMIADHIVNSDMTLSIDSGTFISSVSVPWIEFSTPVIRNVKYIFPADDGEADEVLETDGAGILDWVAQTGGSGGGGSVAVGTGSLTSMVAVASNTALTISFSSNSFAARLIDKTTAFIQLRFNKSYSPLQARTPGDDPCVVSNSTDSWSPFLLCDDSTQESFNFTDQLFQFSGSTFNVDVLYSMVSATADDVILISSIACITPGDAVDPDANAGDGIFGKSFNGATVTDPVPGTVGHIGIATIGPINDTCQQGDLFQLYVERQGAPTADDASGDIEIRSVRLYEP